MCTHVFVRMRILAGHDTLRAMRIVLDCSSAVRPEATGVAMYIRRLVAALGKAAPAEQFQLVHRFRLRGRRNYVPPPAANFTTTTLIEALHPLFGCKCDVFHGLDARLPGEWLKAKLVVTIHDVFSALQSDQFATSEFRALKAKRYQEIAKRADRIIVVSEASKRDVLETIAPDPAKLRVIYEAAGSNFSQRHPEEIAGVRKTYGLDRPYFFYVGTINKRKNLPNMIKAFAQAREKSRADVQFVIAGRIGFGGEELDAAISSAGAATYVKKLGYVRDEDIPALYSGAYGLLFVTQYEGFGIPVVEAFACGCPVLGGSRGSVPEIAGDAGLIADPGDVGAIAVQIQRLISDAGLRATLKTRGLARAQQFSWERTAKACLDVYRELA